MNVETTALYFRPASLNSAAIFWDCRKITLNPLHNCGDFGRMTVNLVENSGRLRKITLNSGRITRVCEPIPGKRSNIRIICFY